MANKYLDSNGLLYFWQKITSAISTAINGKVDKVDGKGLSTNDYSTDEKNKLTGIQANANNYSLPTASSSTLGGVRVGSNLSISDGVLSAANTVYAEATSSANGLMSANDKSKLDGVAINANNYSLPIATSSTLGGVKIDGSTITINNGVISAAQGVEFLIVDVLPTDAQRTGVIYLVPKSGSAQDVYDEYIWCLQNDDITYGWEHIGSTDVDLSGYMQTSDMAAITNSEIDTIVAS